MIRRTRCFFAASSSSSTSVGGFDPFKALGLPNTATKEEVKHRYRELAMKFHPDSGLTSDTDKMESINRAYNLLVKQGMVDQLRASSSNNSGASVSDDSRAAVRPGSQTDRAGVVDTGDDFDDDDAAQAATLDPSTERISDDGSHFVYLDRASGKWVHRRKPLTKPRQPRYGTFQQEKQTLDLHDEIRKRQMAQQKHEEEKTEMARRTMRWTEENMPFNSKAAFAVCAALYAWWAYLTYHRMLGKKHVWDDRRDFFFNKRGHKRVVQEAYEELEIECNLAAEAAAIIFLAAALKTTESDPVQAPTEIELGHKNPYHWYMLWNSM